MFVLRYKDNGKIRAGYFDNKCELARAVWRHTRSREKENDTYNWSLKAGYKDSFRPCEFIKIECVDEEAFKAKVEDTVKKICNKCNIGYSYVGWDNDSITFDIDILTSWIKYHDNYGYYIVIKKYEPDGTMIELFSIIERDKNKFISQSVDGIKKAMKEIENAGKETNDTWHKRYSKGGTKKKDINDRVSYYYRDNGDRIVVGYEFNKVVGYSAFAGNGARLGYFKRLTDAKEKF